MAETNEPKEAPKPWEESWKEKTNQAITMAGEAVQKAVEGVKSGKMPWELSWKDKKPTEASRPSPEASMPKAPRGGINVRTEAAMKVAAVIQPDEVQPDTRSDESNLAEIDKEIARAKDPNILAVLKEERKRYVKGVTQQSRSSSGDSGGSGLPKLIEQVSGTPEYQSLTTLLRSRDAVPSVEVKAIGGGGAFSYSLDKKGDKGKIELSPGLFYQDDSPTKSAPDTLIHELTHAADRQLTQLKYELLKKPERNRTMAEDQFLQGMQKLDFNPNSRERNPTTALAKKLNADWFEKNQDYRSGEGELRSFAMGRTQSGKKQYDPPDHLDTTLATEFMIMIDLANRIKGK